MDNQAESNKVLKSHPVDSNASDGLVVRNKSGFSTLYRLIDLCSDLTALLSNGDKLVRHDQAKFRMHLP